MVLRKIRNVLSPRVLSACYRAQILQSICFDKNGDPAITVGSLFLPALPTASAVVRLHYGIVHKLEYQAIRALMDAEDPRIALAFEAKVLYGDSVKKIAADLGVSEPRIYQLINRAKTIGKQYRKDNDNE